MEELRDKQWPQKGDEYWAVNGGVIEEIWTNDIFDNNRMDTGLIFKTKEEAQHCFDKVVARTAVTTKIKELNDWWKPDWEDENQQKRYCFFNHSENKFEAVLGGFIQDQPSEFYMKSPFDLEKHFDLETLKLAYGVE